MADRDAVDKMLDELLKGKKPEEILGQGGLARELTKHPPAATATKSESSPSPRVIWLPQLRISP